MNTTQTTENPLGYERIGRLLASYAIPSIISLIINSLYNMVDQIFIGQGVGFLGNGATNIIAPIATIAIAVATLFGDGLAAFFSLNLGQGNADKAAKGVGTAVIASGMISVLYAVFAFIFLSPLCRIFGATDSLMPYAVGYGRIIVISFPFAIVATVINSAIRTDGSPRYAMFAMMIGAILNTILDPIFIFFFHWGVKGAAWATIAGQILNAFLYFAYIWKFKCIKLDKTCFRISGKVLAKISSLGISSFITQIAIVLVTAVTNNILVSYGAESKYGADIPLTTIGITMKVNQIVTAILLGLATGAQPVYGYNYGSGQKDRVKQTYRIVLTVSTAVLILAFIVFQLAPMSIVQIFGSESELYNEFAVKCFRIFLLACPINGLQIATGIFFQSIGKPTQATVLSLSRQIVYLLPAMILLPLALGVEGALWAGPLADVLAFITALAMLKIYWKKI